MVIYKVKFSVELWCDGLLQDTEIECVSVASKDMETAIARARKYAAKHRHKFEPHEETYEGETNVFHYKNFRVTECVIAAESDI